MSIKPRQMLVSPSKYSIKCPNQMKAEYITYHETYNDASANNEVKYMISNNNSVSFHFAVDDIEVVQGIPLERNAWHCGDGIGDGNRKSIGIEVCYSKSGGEKYKKAEQLAIKFIAQLLYERKWNIDRVRTHKSWTEIGYKKGYSTYIKNCPHRALDEGRWQSILNAIQDELNKLNNKLNTNKPAPPTRPKQEELYWDGLLFRKGQIGKVTIKKPINLWTDDENGKLKMVRILQPNETYRVYGYRDAHGGQLDLGGGCWLTRIPTHIDYLTPSKSLLAKAKELYG